MRREQEYCEAVIVVSPTTEEQLGELYELLVEFDADDASFVRCCSDAQPSMRCIDGHTFNQSSSPLSIFLSSFMGKIYVFYDA